MQIIFEFACVTQQARCDVNLLQQRKIMLITLQYCANFCKFFFSQVFLTFYSASYKCIVIDAGASNDHLVKLKFHGSSFLVASS